MFKLHQQKEIKSYQRKLQKIINQSINQLINQSINLHEASFFRRTRYLMNEDFSKETLVRSKENWIKVKELRGSV